MGVMVPVITTADMTMMLYDCSSISCKSKAQINAFKIAQDHMKPTAGAEPEYQQIKAQQN